MTWLPLLAAVAAATSTSTQTSTSTAVEPLRLALVVGNNVPIEDSGYSPLQFADDDALRFAQYFESLGAQVDLLASVDADTRARRPAWSRRAQPPTRARVTASLERLAEKVRAAGDRRTELYVYFSGHGTVSAAQAYLHLLDGPFYRADLHRQVLANIPADRVHVLVDSCHAYFLVNPRGDRVPANRSELDLSRYPHAGFLLSTSREKEVHEWAGYRGGVFSYQVLGALRGAADLDVDDRVTYAELHAYIAAANAAVSNPEARIEPFVRRPTLGGETVVDLRSAAGASRIDVGSELEGHFYVASARGERLLDAHKSAGQPLRLSLPPEHGVFLRLDERLYVPSPDVSRPRFREMQAALTNAPKPRGALADALRKELFARPLTKSFAAGFELGYQQVPLPSVVYRVPRRAWTEDSWVLGLMGAGWLAVVGGAVATGLWVDAKGALDSQPIDAEYDSRRARAETRRIAMASAFSVGGALLAAGLWRALSLGGPGAGLAPIATSDGGGAAVFGRF